MDFGEENWMERKINYPIKDLQIKDQLVTQKSGTDIHPVLILQMILKAFFRS